MAFRDWPPWFMVSGMSKSTEDPLVAEIRHALMPGRLVKWDAVSGLVADLDQVHEKVEASVKRSGQAGSMRFFSQGFMPKSKKQMTNVIWRISFIA